MAENKAMEIEGKKAASEGKIATETDGDEVREGVSGKEKTKICSKK